MTTHYVVELELDIKPTAAAAERALEALEEIHPAAGTSAAGLLEVVVTLPAEGLRQAVAIALALVEHQAPAIRVSAMPETVRDARAGWAAVDDLVGATEAAEILGVSRQRIPQLVAESKLPNRKVGREYVFPRAAVEALRK